MPNLVLVTLIPKTKTDFNKTRVYFRRCAHDFRAYLVPCQQTAAGSEALLGKVPNTESKSGSSFHSFIVFFMIQPLHDMTTIETFTLLSLLHDELNYYGDSQIG